MNSQLRLGNVALRSHDAVAAIRHYLGALEESPTMARFITFNIASAQQRLLEQHATAGASRVGVVVSGDLSQAHRALSLCLLHGRDSEVELIAIGAEPAAAAAGDARPGLPTRWLALDDDAQVQAALQSIVDRPLDTLHLCQPLPAHRLLGLLYRLVWGTRVVLDLEQAEADWPGDLAQAGPYDALTVAHPGLQGLFGGILVHHARDAGQFAASATLRRTARERLQLAEQRKVVLVCASKRQPSALDEVVSAVAALARNDVIVLVAGARARRGAEPEPRGRADVKCRLLGDVPFERMPEIHAAADVHVVLRDQDEDPALASLPASIAESLLMCVPTVVRLPVGLLGPRLSSSVIDAGGQGLTQALAQVLQAEPAADSTGPATGAPAEFALAHNAQALALLRSQLAPGPWAAGWGQLAESALLPSPLRQLASAMMALPPLSRPPVRAAPSKAAAVAGPLVTEQAPSTAEVGLGGAAGQAGPEAVARSSVWSAPAAPMRKRAATLTEWLPVAEMRPGAHEAVVELFGQPLALWPRQSLGSTPDTALAPLWALARLHGREQAGAVRLRPQPEQGLPQALALAAWPRRCCSWTLPAAGVRIADVWAVSDKLLRLRVESLRPGSLDAAGCVLRASQIEPGDEALAMVAEAVVASDGPVFIDLDLVNPYFPVLISTTDLRGRWLEATLLPFPSLCRGAPHHGELHAIGERADPMEGLEDAANSLAAELVGGAGDFSIGRLDVHLVEAIGAEKIFSSTVKEWLLEVMGLGPLQPIPAPDGDSAAVADYLRAACELPAAEAADGVLLHRARVRRAAGRWALQLAADSLPSISALVSRRLPGPDESAETVGSWVVSHFATGRPRVWVSLPPMSPSLLSLQPLDRACAVPTLMRADAVAPLRTLTPRRPPFPLTLRLRDPAREPPAVLLQPVAADGDRPLLRRQLDAEQRANASISALWAPASGELSGAAMLQSLARQTLARRLDIVVVRPAGASAETWSRVEQRLQALFPQRWRTVDGGCDNRSADFNAAAAAASGSHLLLLGTETLLHDTRTLETLYTLALEPGVCTASCVLLHEVQNKRGAETGMQAGGFFPRQLSLQGRPSLVIDEPCTSEAFPAATYPVLGNSFRLALVNAGHWRALGGLDAQRFPWHRSDLDFCLRALRAGHTHLCTAVVSAFMATAGRSEQHRDTHALGFMQLERWHEVLESVSLIRELGP
jgi:hypothetical protein